MKNALTIDVEDFFHVHAFKDVIARDEWDDIPTRVLDNTRFILRLLREFDTRATFFVLGWVAEKHPEIVREIVGDGHELASHGFAHESVYELTPVAFRQDIERSVDTILAACPNIAVRGYRAPSFSITENTTWAFTILTELGMLYDSSIFPTSFHDRYGIRSAPRFAHPVGSAIWEIPLSTIRAFGYNWPVGGGGYFRLMPLWVTAWSMRRINREGQPAVVYLHPWEFDPHQPRVTTASRRSKFRHYINLHRTEPRLRKLLRQFSFGPIVEVFQQQFGKVARANETTAKLPGPA